MLSEYLNPNVSKRLKHQPLFIARSYLSWYLFEYAQVLDKKQYEILPGKKFFDPFVPIQQIPETNDLLGEAPFLVYALDYSDRQDENIFIKKEQMEIDIYASNYFDIIVVASATLDAIDRQDLTAQDINEFYINQCKQTNEQPEIKFLTSNMFSSDEQLPANQPMGRISKPLFWQYEYTRCFDNRMRFAY